MQTQFKILSRMKQTQERDLQCESKQPNLSNQVHWSSTIAQNAVSFALRKSFALGRIDIGFPGSYAHQVFQNARSPRDSDAVFDIGQITGSSPLGNQATRLLLPLPDFAIALFHYLLPVCLLLQLLAYLVMTGLMDGRDLWLRSWVLRSTMAQQGWVHRKVLLWKPIGRITLPLDEFEKISRQLLIFWYSIFTVYLPLALWHQTRVLDTESQTWVYLI